MSLSHPQAALPPSMSDPESDPREAYPTAHHENIKMLPTAFQVTSFLLVLRAHTDTLSHLLEITESFLMSLEKLFEGCTMPALIQGRERTAFPDLADWEKGFRRSRISQVAQDIPKLEARTTVEDCHFSF